MSATSITHCILDADGVLWDVDKPKEGIAEFISTLRDLGIRFTVATNIARYDSRHFVEKFKRFGVTVSAEEIITSPQATASYLRRTAPDARVFMVGEDGLRRELEAAGVRVINDEWKGGAWLRPPSHVVVGLDTGLDYPNKLAPATTAIKDHGAVLISTNPDRLSKHSSGANYPGGGAVAALLAYCTGVTPIVIGKPEPTMFEEAMQRMRATPHTTVVIGDNLETEILAGHRLGMPTWLVLSGITSHQDVQRSACKPDKIFADIRDITAFLRK
jgi:4-nitrophenyl phosphatase